MKKRCVSIMTSLLILCCLSWSVSSIAANYDPLVEQVQKRLTELGYDPGPVDGLWGRKTETAVKSFQQDHHLPETGKLDEETLRELGLTEAEEKTPAAVEQIDTLYQQALEYYNAGNYEKAIEYYTKVIELDSSYAEAYRDRGVAYGEQGEYDLAISDFRKMTELKPDSADGYGMWGATLIVQGKFEEAKTPCRKAYKLAPDNIAWTMDLGHTYLLTGDRGTARTYYKKALSLIQSEEDLQNAIALFKVFIEIDQQAEASRQELAWMEQEFQTIRQGQAEELFQQALAYHQAENYEKAVEYYAQVIERDATYSDAYWNRGLIYAEHGIYDLAASDFRKVAELLPDFADVYGNLGLCLFLQDKFEEAKKAYQKAIELVPDNVTWMMNLGHTYFLTRDRKTARKYYAKAVPLFTSEEDFTQAISAFEALIQMEFEVKASRQELAWMRQEFDKIQQQRTEALYQQAVRYDEAGEDDKAIEQYTQVIERDPGFTDAYWNRGVIYGQKGQIEAAMTNFRKVTELEPDSVRGYRMLGWFLVQQGQFEEARKPYQKAHELEPEEFAWAFALGHTYLLTGDIQTARTYYTSALPLLGSEQEFEAAVAVFDEFMEKGWQVETCRQELAWLKEEFKKEQQRQIDALYQQAKEYEEAGDDKKAIEFYGKVLERDSTRVEAYWDRWQLYDEQENYDVAVADLRKVIELNPDFTEAYGELGWLLTKQGKFKEAKDLCYTAQQRDPATLRWTMCLGHTYLLTGYPVMARGYYREVLAQVKSKEEFTQAISTFEQFIKNGWQVEACQQESAWMEQELKTRIDTLFHQANGYNEEEYDKAIEEYTQVIALDPKYVDAYWNRGLIYKQQEKYDLAIADFQKVTELKPDFADAHGMLGWCLITQKEFYKARRAFRKVEKVESKNFKWVTNIGHTYLLTGDVTTARKYYEEALPLIKSEETLQEAISAFEFFIEKGWQVEACRQELAWMTQEFEKVQKKKQIEALYQQATGYYDAENYEKAIEFYTKVLDHDSTYVDAYWSRGWSYVSQEKYELAIADFLKVTDLKPDLAGGYGGLGWSLLMQGKFEEAKEPFLKAHELEPKWMYWILNLGHTYLLTGDKATARTYYEKVIDKVLSFGNSEEVFKAVIRDFEFLIEKGWQMEACRQEIAWMEQEFKIQQQIKPLYQQAEEYRQAKECDKAIESYTKVVELDPTHGDAYWNRGLCYMDQEKADLAATDFRQVTALKPNWGEAYGRLGIALIVQGNYKEAQEVCQKASELEPEEGIWTFYLGHTYLLSGDAATARTYYEDSFLFIKSKEELEAAISLIQKFIDKGWQKEACEQTLTWMEQILEAGYEDFIEANSYWAHAKRYQEKGDYGGALGLYEWGLEKFEWGCGWSYTRAIESYQNYQMGLEDFEWKINEEQGIPKPWQARLATVLQQMGYCLLGYDEPDNAFVHYGLALELDRKLGREAEIAEGLKSIGMIYHFRRDYIRATEHYEQALELFRKLNNEAEIAESLRLLGRVHYEHGQPAKALEYYASALELFRKIGDDEKTAIVLNDSGMAYHDLGQNGKALEYLEQALKINHKLNDEKNIATNLNNMGLAYTGLGQYEKALEYYEQALELDQKLEQEADIATVLSNIGLAYSMWGLYEKALNYYEQALELRRKLSRDADVVSTLNEISFVYQDKGQYDKALDYLEQALRLAKQLEWDAGVAKCLKGLGLIYAQLGQYDKAFEYSEQALELNRKLGIDIEVVGDITNIASVYFSWGKWDKALEYSEQALELAHKLKRDDILATTLNNMGMFYATWKQYDKALNYFEQALELDRKLNREPGIATDLNNIATIYGDWGQYDKALEYFEQVLESFRKVGKDAGSAVLLGNIGTVYREWKQYDKALEYYKQELEIYRKLRRETEIAKTLYDIGGLYFEYLKQYPEAIPYLIEAIELIEKLRKTAPKDIRRDFLAGWITPYYVLTLCYIYTGDFANAFQTYELSRARWLAEQLAGYDADIEIPSIQHIQSELAEDTAILVYVASMAVFVITKEDYTIVELPKDEFVQEMMTDYRQEIENALKNVKNPTQTVFPRKEGEEFMTLEIENTDFNKIIQYYRLVGNPKAGRGSVIRFDNQEQRENVQQVLSKRLYRFFLGHIQDHITGKTKLLIVPDGLLNFLPFETLLDVQGKYAVETYQISYTPSLTVLETIQQRQYDPSRKPLLAFGGAVYNPQTYQGDTIENQAQLASLQRQADWLLSQGSPLEELYGKLGYTTWNNLPGTLHEVTMLQQIVNGADIVTGEQVTESTVKELSDKGNLADYTVLHFATHGIAVPELPELSALVLSRKDNSEDGYLRVEEIAELDIQADFVNLSACETGLGRINSGEGVLGLTQAFLVAGAKGLSVSLWQVADESTAEFMVALYKLVEEQGLSYAEAMTEVKRRFIKGEFGKKWTAPFYWAPFVYYGKN